MTRRNLAALIVITVIAALLAFPFREAVYHLVMIPLAYVFWLLGLFYRSIDQSFWWIGIVLIVLLVLGTSLLPEIKPNGRKIDLQREERGGVESFAHALAKSNQGTYFKWIVANRLGKLAHQLLSLREHGKPRSLFAPLAGESWEPPDEVRQYLERGLQGSFADFPSARWYSLSQPQKTPLDLHVKEAVEFLESQQIDSHPK
ncbi:MAG TPA: hypothetical protein PKK96_02895 [Anaerolineales bacterium]|nr:hypothetical protein [Anaerolineales bacterium]HNQ94357.1 hypothetical protein [Anaerolineales bacterium]HNS59927.1 hypothetical protein [Anaerolineales bacterium]